VNRSTAPRLNSGKDRLDDILVLHLQGGKDLFVSFPLGVANSDQEINMLTNKKLGFCKQMMCRYHGKTGEPL